MNKDIDMESIKGFLTRNWVVISIVMVGISLRLFFLNHESFWIDEAMTGLRSRWDYAYMFKEISAGDQMPLYFTFTWLVARNFGNSVLVLRGLSLVFGVLAFIPVYKIGKKFGDRAALIGLALIAFNPTMIYYSQEARMYMLMVLLSSTSMLLYLEYMNPTRYSRKASGSFMAVTNVVLIYIHYFGALFVGLQLLSFFITHIYRSYSFSRSVSVKELTRYSTPMSISLLSFLPWLIFQQSSNSISDKTTGGTLGLSWALIPETYSFMGGQYTAVLKNDTNIAFITGIILAGALILSLIFIFLKRRKEEGSDLSVFLILASIMLFLSPILVMVISYNFTPMYNHRYFVFMALPFIMIIAIAISRIGWKDGIGKGSKDMIPVILVLVLLAPSLATDIDQLAGRDKADWKGAIEHILTNQKEGDVVIPVPDYEQMVIYYYTDDLYISLIGAIEDRTDFLVRNDRVWVVFYDSEPIDSYPLIIELNSWNMELLEIGKLNVRLYEKNSINLDGGVP